MRAALDVKDSADHAHHHHDPRAERRRIERDFEWEPQGAYNSRSMRMISRMESCDA